MYLRADDDRTTTDDDGRRRATTGDDGERSGDRAGDRDLRQADSQRNRAVATPCCAAQCCTRPRSGRSEAIGDPGREQLCPGHGVGWVDRVRLRAGEETRDGPSRATQRGRVRPGRAARVGRGGPLVFSAWRSSFGSRNSASPQIRHGKTSSRISQLVEDSFSEVRA